MKMLQSLQDIVYTLQEAKILIKFYYVYAANRVAMEMVIAGVFPLTPTEKLYTSPLYTQKFKSRRSVNYRVYPPFWT